MVTDLVLLRVRGIGVDMVGPGVGRSAPSLMRARHGYGCDIRDYVTQIVAKV